MLKMKMGTVGVATILTATLVAACAGSTPPSEQPEAPSSEAPADDQGQKGDLIGVDVTEESTERVEFDEMSAPEKMQHMKKVVAPQMAKVFQEADAEEFADFGCTTCHGPGAKQGNFAMPSSALPALDQEEMEEHPEVTQFMKERVVPEMASLLGEEPYNMETGEGFGCYHCHTKKAE